MFFGKLFAKNYDKLKGRADSLFTSERFAEARLSYIEALEIVDRAADQVSERSYLESRISQAGNRLAEMNIVEADAAIRSGDLQKGQEHLKLSLELADDVTIREKAEMILNSAPAKEEPVHHEQDGGKGHACSGCSTSSSGGNTELTTSFPEDMKSEEQFHLLVHTLPGDLPHRYETLGEEFASAYLLAHSDQLAAALKSYKNLLSRGENDILLCEIALLEYRMGERNNSVTLLKRSIEIDNNNALSYLSLAQIYMDSNRYDDAIMLLNEMISRQILQDQALIMLGDVHAHNGNLETALEIYTKGLNVPALKKVAAERLVQALIATGRKDEAAYLAKTYLKGCC